MSYLFSGIVVSSISGGVSLLASGNNIPSQRVSLAFTGSGRVFVGQAPVGSGSTDLQRVGFPIYPTFSGNLANIQYIETGNPSILNASAEQSGQILFIGVEYYYTSHE